MPSSAVAPVYSVETDAPVVNAITALINDINQLQTGSSGVPAAITTSTLTVSSALHSGRVVVLDRALGIAVTLPPATGSGVRYNFAIKTTAAGGSYVISRNVTADKFVGFSLVTDGVGNTKGFGAVANTDNNITMNGTTSGGYAGDYIHCDDIAANLWEVRVFGKATGVQVTPFSAT